MFSPHLSRLKCIVRSMMRIPRVCNTPALFIAVVVSIFSLRAFAANPPCPLNTTNPSVTVCTPTPNQVVGISPAHVVAGTTDTNTVVAVQIYVDNQLVTQVNSNAIDTYVPLPIGPHLVTVQGWDRTGATFKTNVPISLSPPCALNATNRTVTICTPGGAAVVSNPVHLVAGMNDSNPVTSVQVLADGQPVFQNSAAPLDVYITSLSAGPHTLAVQAQDGTGTFSNSRNITVTSNSGLSNLRHIIFFVQENRSFDSYFGRLGPYRVSLGLSNNVDGVPLNATLLDTSGVAVHPYHYQTVCTDNMSPFWNESHFDFDGGKMDNFLKTTTSAYSSTDPTGTRAMGYYDQTDLPYYYALATQFATTDRFFSSVMSNTNANRMYLFAATSFGHIRPDTPPTGGWTQPTIFDHLDDAGVSWRYYYQDNGAYLPQWSTYQRDAAKLKPIANWYTDLQNESTMPSVIFIERAGPSGLDEHPGNNVQKGAADVAKIINALLTSPSWRSSALIRTYDESGGLYDHVVSASMNSPDATAPMLQSGDKPGDFAHSGFRVPMVVVSSWVKPHYVSHTWRDYTSILRLIEVRFNVAPLTARDAAADDMMEFFNFSSQSWSTPPSLPAQPTNGTCDTTLERAPGR